MNVIVSAEVTSMAVTVLWVLLAIGVILVTAGFLVQAANNRAARKADRPGDVAVLLSKYAISVRSVDAEALLAGETVALELPPYDGQLIDVTIHRTRTGLVPSFTVRNDLPDAVQ